MFLNKEEVAGGGLLSVGGGQQLQPTNYTRVCMGRGRCVCMGGVCDIPHRIGEKVPNAIYVESPLSREGLFGFKVDNIYTVGSGLLQMVSEPIPDPDVGVCLAP